MSDLVSEWVTKGEEDWSSAQILLRDESPLVTPALFHLQQCAKKLLSDVGDFREVILPLLDIKGC